MSNSHQRKPTDTAKATRAYPLEFLNYPVATAQQAHPRSEWGDTDAAYRKAQAARQSGRSQFSEPHFRAMAASFYVNQARAQAASSPLRDDRFRQALSALAPREARISVPSVPRP